MTVGPGKYDDEVTRIMKAHHAKGVVLIVFGGDRGEGFSVQATLGVTLALPKILRDIADDIVTDIPDMRPHED